MAFRFPLATVLRLRESIEKREEVALQSIQLEIARVRRSIDELTVEIAQKYETLYAEMQRPMQANLLQLILAELSAAIEKRQDLALALEVLQQKQKEQLKSYRMAHRGRQMLTDMRKDQKLAYEQKQDRMQQKFLDDIFVAHSQSN